MAKPLLRTLLDASTVGINLVAATFVGLAMGYFLDSLLGTSPWMKIVFLVLGIIAGFIGLFRFARKRMENTGGGDESKKQPPPPASAGEVRDERVRYYGAEELKDVDLGEGEEERIENGDADDEKNI
jgi:ATP synthase protein I